MTTAQFADRLAEDEANREFIQNQVGLSCFVEAGAGSGKTVMLIQRLLTLIIEHGVRIDEIAAITFNEAAAAELTARLRRALIQVCDTGEYTLGNGAPRTFADAALAKTRAADALQGLPGAALGTLHSFCLRVLKQYPLEAGLPPKVDAVDDLAAYFSPAQHSEAIIETITALFEGDEEAAAAINALPTDISAAEFLTQLQFLLGEGVTFQHIQELAEWMDAHWGELDATIAAPAFEAPSEDELRASLHKELRLIRDRAHTAGVSEKLLAFFDDRLADLDAAESLADLKLGKPGNTGGSKPEAKQAKDEYKAFLAQLEALGLYAGYAATSTIAPVLAALVREAADARRRTGVLEFHDMIYLTQKLVDNDEVRAKLHEQYRVIFVDEFQDTDPAQLDIVTAIARGPHDTPQPGRLFMVGDPKQSIYKFRNADIDTYVAARTSAAARDADHGVKQLSRNFRSSQAVVAAVNELYGQLFDAHVASTDGPAQAHYVPMLPQDATDGREGAFIVLQDPDAQDLPPTELREREAADVVALIRAAVAGVDPRFVHHSGTRAGGPMRYSDIAIVVPTHNDALRLMQVLDSAAIPWVSEGSGALFATPELNDLFTVLRAIADPADDFTRVAALRTALVGCSDAEIAGWAQQDPTATRVVEAEAQLRRLAGEALRVDAASMVRSVVSEFGLAEAYAASGHPDHLPRVETLLALADRFSAATGLGLREFVHWSDAQAETNQGVTEPLLDTGTDAVRFMTIHKSKGREFPMVIAAGMSGHTTGSRAVRAFSRENRTAQFKLKDAQTPDYLLAKAFDDEADANELIRLLYVAMTRAKSVLAIPLQLKRNKTGTRDYAKAQRGAKLAAVIDDSTQYAPITREELPGFDATAAPATPDAEPGAPAAKRFNANAEALAEATGITQRMGVTAIAHAADQTDGTPRHTRLTGTRLRASLDEQVSRAGYPARQITTGLFRDNAGTEFGSAVHDVMEHLPAGGELEQIAATVASLYELPEGAAKEVARVADCFAQSAPYARSLETESHREVPVIGTVDGTAVNGYIDLLYADGDAWVIADWKTDVTATPETVTSYFVQLDIYATFLEEALGQKVTRLELVFAGAEGPQVVVHERSA
ncbi:UvrD-helicase domain-containing protein [Corynebacterium imitans]|uniref:UvrD-helicase domain-containing protein n=1 Tax=Corynebacterium imitans TaxID=156978 RepID=UPI001EF32C49|nr:UvrD-helicase domain-containing protein [Corynebacterium imitans]MCG7278768.1 UvrD-helicase domain-containing protein [Corynebacterium imitans]